MSLTFGSAYLRYAKRDGVAWLTIDRPELRNAMSLEMYRGVRQAILSADDDPDIHLTVITGVGDTFCVGGGLTLEALCEFPENWTGLDFMPNKDGTPSRQTGNPAPDWEQILPNEAVIQSKKTVMTVVNGHCIGGGFILAMSSDITIASERAEFRVPELLRGVPDQWIATRLPMYVGMERAKYLMLTCQAISAQTAAEWGLVSEVVAHETLLARAEALADLICMGAPIARSVYKAHANRYLLRPDPAICAMASIDEQREGFLAFAEKRAPSLVPSARRRRG